jgi:chromosome segregation ATPase
LTLLQENKSLSSQLNDLRLQVERLDYDNKEGVITVDILKEQNQDAKSELEELRMTIADLKTAQKDASAEDKEKRKQEKMAMMMAKFDTVSCVLFNDRNQIDISFYNSKGNSQRRMNNSDRSFLN